MTVKGWDFHLTPSVPWRGRCSVAFRSNEEVFREELVRALDVGVERVIEVV